MKYIDADRLKAKIEKHIKEVKDMAERFTPNWGLFDARLCGIYDVMAILDSLQQVQPEVDLESEIKRVMLKLPFFLQAKDQIDFARHFYELGLNARTED